MQNTAFDLSAYEENINTEFRAPHAMTIPIKALKTDAQGKQSLKNQLGVGKVKTCDYIYMEQEQLVMIECSDLKSQDENVEKLLKRLKEKLCPVDQHNKRYCIKNETLKLESTFKAKDLIFTELRQKCIETTLLTHKIADKAGFVYTDRFKKQKFLIVIKQMSPTDAPAMQALVTKLSSALKDIVCTIKVIPQQALQSQLRH